MAKRAKGKYQKPKENVEAVESEIVPDDEELSALPDFKKKFAKERNEEELYPELNEESAYQTLLKNCLTQFSGILEKYWQMGKYISEFLNAGNREKTYGKGIHLKLGIDLNMDPSTIYRARSFYLALPSRDDIKKIHHFSWRNVRKLLPAIKKCDTPEDILQEAEEFRPKSKDEFESWMEEVYSKHLGSDYKSPGRPKGAMPRIDKTIDRLLRSVEDFEVEDFNPKEDKDFEYLLESTRKLAERSAALLKELEKKASK